MGDKMLAHTGDVVTMITSVFKGTTASLAICNYLKAKNLYKLDLQKMQMET
jgi:hypothetical protein